MKAFSRYARLVSAVALAACGLTARGDAGVAGRARMEPVHKEFLAAHCFKCHNDKDAGGQVRLDDIPLEIADVQTAERWQKVLGVLNSGEMPPEEEPRPPDAAKAAFLEVLSKQMVIARKALADTGGRITMRRLNRREYVNTIRDLLDVQVNARDLPSDEAAGTFDTIGSGLFFSSDQFETYVRLGRAALDEAIVTTPKPEVKRERLEPEVARNAKMKSDLAAALETLKLTEEWRRTGKRPDKQGWSDDYIVAFEEKSALQMETRCRQYLADPATRTGAYLGLWPQELRIPGNLPPGRYVLRGRLGFPPDAVHVLGLNYSPLLKREPYPDIASLPRFVEWGEAGDFGFPFRMSLLGCMRVVGTPDRPEILELPVTISKANTRTFALRERLGNNDSEATGALGGAWEYRLPNQIKNRFRHYQSLWIDWIEWEGPFVDQWPPRSHELALGSFDLSKDPGEAEARAVIHRFAERAFRGLEVQPAYVDGLVAQYAERRAAGEPFIQAIKTPLSLVLASPSFLYIAEPTLGDAAAPPQPLVAQAQAAEGGAKPEAASVAAPSNRMPLTDVELANRLSYFLWSGPPDERLLILVRSKRLRQPDVLKLEVDRLLSEQNAMRFISGFTHQWLDMTRLDFFRFSFRLYPLFDDSLKESARREVYETIRTVLEEDLPLGTLLKSDFVVINDLLAQNYGIPGVDGPSFRKMRVPARMPRGGLLGMAAIHAMGSDGERASPVERGAWVLRKLLNDPPPPAPANVPQLSRLAERLLPARELMTAHQEQPQCAHCHAKIDPIGYGLQNFDASGRWRTEELVEFPQKYKEAFFPVDAHGQLPDGTPFDGFVQLRDAVAKHEDAFARGFVEHLVEYALGRPYSFSDEQLVETILAKAKPKRYPIRLMIQSLVASPEFQSK